jgi:hypothetical protein
MKTSIQYEHEVLWESIAKKYQIEDATWEKVMVVDLNMDITYQRQILDDVMEQKYSDLVYSIFYFGPQPLTLTQSKKKFQTSLKKYWYIFCENNLIEVWCKIVSFIRQNNRSKEVVHQHYINLVPGFEGKHVRKRRVVNITLP